MPLGSYNPQCQTKPNKYNSSFRAGYSKFSEPVTFKGIYSASFNEEIGFTSEYYCLISDFTGKMRIKNKDDWKYKIMLRSYDSTKQAELLFRKHPSPLPCPTQSILTLRQRQATKKVYWQYNSTEGDPMKATDRKIFFGISPTLRSSKKSWILPIPQ